MISLTDICLQRPYRERLELCLALKESLEQERQGSSPEVRTRGRILLDMMEDIIGVPIVKKSRTPVLAWARAMVAYQLLKEGYGVAEAGRMLDRNHSTISVMRDKVEWLLQFPRNRKNLFNIWEQFQKAIQDDIQRRTTQDIVSLGGSFPDGCQCKMGEESGQ